MPGKHITDQQIRLYMNERKLGAQQTAAAAKSGISERSARRIDQHELTTHPSDKRSGRTRKDPLAAVWESELVPMLEENPSLLPATLFEVLCEKHPDTYDAKILRTLQRRMKSWKAKHGPAKEVMFRQIKTPGHMGISDFTTLKKVTISVKGKTFKHILYHYRLVFSGWCYVKVICGGESFTALSSGLQTALWRSGGAPVEHRTDSLSAAFKNASEKEELTARYDELCKFYGLKASRNNPGLSHENGAIESPHGHLKRRIEQALLLRGSNDFPSLEEYQLFIDGLVLKINRRCQERFNEEKAFLKSLPKRRTQDYGEHYVFISRSSTFDLQRVTYTVPSRFIGERLYVQLFDHELKLFHGHVAVLTLTRIHNSTKQRIRSVNYRHVIDSLVRKPQAFRSSQIRDDLLPTPDYQRIWLYVDNTLEAHKACRYIVRLLHLAAKEDCEGALGRYVLTSIDRGTLPSELDLCKRFSDSISAIPVIANKQHSLSGYDDLLSGIQEVIIRRQLTWPVRVN